MKLRELKEIVDIAMKRLEGDPTCNPDVFVMLDEEEFEIVRVGQFGLEPDVVIDVQLLE